MEDVIAIEGLIKRFGRSVALDGLDLRVAQGQIHGVLGPNGAGKSTMIRVLLGLLRADGGTVRLLGGDPWRDAVALHRRLTYVPGEVDLWPTLTGGEVIDLLGRLQGGLDPARRDRLIARFELDPSKRSRNYSKGNRQKVALVAALAVDAELLVLDEPTAGLDPLMESIFQDEIRDIARDGRTVLLSSHILSEVESLCDHVTIIRAGRVVETGSLAALRHLRRTTIDAETVHPPDPVATMPGVHRPTVRGRHIRFDADADRLGAIVARLGELGVRSLVSRPPTLEELFLRHYGNGSRDAGEEPEG